MSLVFSVINNKTIVGTNNSDIGNGINYVGYSGTLIIPKFHNGSKVAEIGSHAFHSCLNIKEIQIHGEIEQIHSRAFYNCQSLEKINIPPSVTFIGNATFCMRDNVGETTPGSIVITFQGESRLSNVGHTNFARKNAIVIYYCGLIPIAYLYGNFALVNEFHIFSSTVLSFLEKPATNIPCPSVDCFLQTKYKQGDDHCFSFIFFISLLSSPLYLC